jgi:hypothetical protein
MNTCFQTHYISPFPNNLPSTLCTAVVEVLPRNFSGTTNEIQDKQSAYNITLRRVLVTIAVLENQ